MHTSHWVKNIEFESVIAVCASVFALDTTHVLLEVKFLYATAVFGNEGAAFTLLLLCRHFKVKIKCFSILPWISAPYFTIIFTPKSLLLALHKFFNATKFFLFSTTLLYTTSSGPLSLPKKIHEYFNDLQPSRSHSSIQFLPVVQPIPFPSRKYSCFPNSLSTPVSRIPFKFFLKKHWNSQTIQPIQPPMSYHLQTLVDTKTSHFFQSVILTPASYWDLSYHLSIRLLNDYGVITHVCHSSLLARIGKSHFDFQPP